MGLIWIAGGGEGTCKDGPIHHGAPGSCGRIYVPKSPAPARNLLVVVNSSKLQPDERAALLSLQGLSSRTQPCIWLSECGNPGRDFALRTMVECGVIDGYTTVADWKPLFKQFAQCYRGAVVYDPQIYRGDTLAATIAGAADLIATSADVASDLQIPVKIDMRGRFTSYADGLNWVWDNYKKKLSRHVCLIASQMSGPASFAIEWRAVVFWTSGVVDSLWPDTARERELVASILSQLQPRAAMLGYPYSGSASVYEVGLKLVSQYGIALIASHNQDNYSVLSGLSDPHSPGFPQTVP